MRPRSTPRHVRIGSGLAVCTAALAALDTPALATDFSWVNPSGGVFENPFNWIPFIFHPPSILGPPGPGEMATFDLGNGGYTVTFTASNQNSRLRIGDDHVVFSLNGQTYTLTSTADTSILVPYGTQDDGLLTLTNGTVSGQSAFIASAFPTTGQVVVGSGATWNLAGTLGVGHSDDGTLVIMSGGDVSCASANVGDNSIFQFGSGNVNVTGAGSTWTISGPLTVANQGSGSLTIDGAGADVSSFAAVVGGVGGDGSITVVNGGTLDTFGCEIGAHPAGSGIVSISGTGSIWGGCGNIWVGGGSGGAGGPGTLNVSDGGAVSRPFFCFSDLTIWGPGIVNFDGGSIEVGGLNMNGGAFNWSAGALKLNNTVLDIQPGGALGSLLILDADQELHVGGLRVGVEGPGELQLHGAELSTGNITVGSYNDGTMVLDSGAKLDSVQDGRIGELAGVNGLVTLSGEGTSWTHEGFTGQAEFNIGHDGEGQIAILDGAMLTIDGQCAVTLGRMSGSAGTGTIAGAGSSLEIAAPQALYIGSLGTGTLSVQEGGTLQVLGAFLLGETTGSGALHVDGAGSSASGAVTTVGGFGSGSLTVTGGATMVAGDCYVADSDGSSGDVVVDGEGSHLSALGTFDYFIVAGGGPGSLIITNGGSAETGEMFVGDGFDAVGVVTVSGAGSALSVDEAVFVGFMGEGHLSVQDGGIVSALELAVSSISSLGGNAVIQAQVFNAGMVGPGPGPARLDIAGGLEQSSQGTLAIELGGTVPGVEHDQLAVTGAVVLDGTLDLSFVDGFQATPGQQFTILTAGSLTGTLAAVTGCKQCVVTYLPTAIEVTFGESCGPDTNGDGMVSVTDLVAVIVAWGSADDAADVNGDGTVDVLDMVAVIVAWGPC